MKRQLYLEVLEDRSLPSGAGTTWMGEHVPDSAAAGLVSWEGYSHGYHEGCYCHESCGNSLERISGKLSRVEKRLADVAPDIAKPPDEATTTALNNIKTTAQSIIEQVNTALSPSTGSSTGGDSTGGTSTGGTSTGGTSTGGTSTGDTSTGSAASAAQAGTLTRSALTAQAKLATQAAASTDSTGSADSSGDNPTTDEVLRKLERLGQKLTRLKDKLTDALANNLSGTLDQTTTDTLNQIKTTAQLIIDQVDQALQTSTPTPTT